METQSELRTGDIVCLNSGSPDLKIIALDAEMVEVQWQGEMRLERDAFPRVCVRRITAGNKGIPRS